MVSQVKQGPLAALPADVKNRLLNLLPEFEEDRTVAATQLSAFQLLLLNLKTQWNLKCWRN